ncbi:MAG: D-2-hydroxyacid dehydrogenase [Woeseia sp.]
MGTTKNSHARAVFLDFATLGPSGPGQLDASALLKVLPALEFIDSTPGNEIAERLNDAEFVLTNKARLGAPVLAGATKLRYIGLTATGTDNVDLDAARKRQIAVTNIRAYCTRSVVEHVFAVLLNLTHSIRQYRQAVAAGDWRRSQDFCLLEYPIRELSAMTLGVVGYGELGSAVAKMGEAFGMRTLIGRRRGAAASNDGRVDFQELLERSDVVSLHCPLREETTNLLSAAEFGSMRRQSILINTARGGLVDSQALVDALRDGKIAGAAIDVLREEPPVNGDPLLDYEGANLILTPHIAWGTIEARQNALDELAGNVAAFLEGEERNRVV